MDHIFPLHVGIIMDGNRRWAKGRKLSSLEGHQEGLRRAKEIVKFSSEIGIKYVSLYVFSTENWKRAEDEVGHLMFLISKYLKAEFDFYKKNKIRIMISGDTENLSSDVKSSIKEAIDFTKDFEGLTVNLAINYGGRNEIIRAIKRLPISSLTSLNENEFSIYLDNSELPDVDLLIRTGGDIRISNFLLWRLAYSEFVFSDTLWPDYTNSEFSKDLEQFRIRKRNFGG